MQVKLIIANTNTDTIYFNYGDDYNDITRIFVEDHSPWEEINYDQYYLLRDFVTDFNSKKNRKQFAFLVNKDEQISAQSAIDAIIKKRKKQQEEFEAAERKRKEEERKRKEEAERKKKEKELKKLAKTKEQKRLLLEQLKQELGEQ